MRKSEKSRSFAMLWMTTLGRCGSHASCRALDDPSDVVILNEVRDLLWFVRGITV